MPTTGPGNELELPMGQLDTVHCRELGLSHLAVIPPKRAFYPVQVPTKRVLPMPPSVGAEMEGEPRSRAHGAGAKCFSQGVTQQQGERGGINWIISNATGEDLN